MSRLSVLPVALYALLGVLVIPVFPHAVSPNEYSRWAVDVAIVDYATVELTPLLRDTGFPITDLATLDGRIYSNKAPGLSLLTLPIYAAARAVWGPPSAENMRATLTVMRLAGATLPVILLGLWLGAVARRLGCSEPRVRLAVASLLFATPLFAYGLLFFSHAILSLTLFGVWILLFVEDRTPARELAAGALIGLSVLTESAAAVPSAVLVALALPRLRVQGLLRVIAAGLPFAVAFGVYNALAFGNPFTLPNVHDADEHIRVVNRSGFFGIHVPRLAYLLDMLLDSSKGMLVLSPILLMALAGVGRARRALPTAAFIALLIVPLSIILTISGYPYWFGGRGIGARYIVPMLPFLALLIAFAEEAIAEVVLLGASASTIALLSLVFPFIPTIYAVPWVSFSLPLLMKGCIAPNLLHFLWRPMAIVVPFAIVAAAVGSVVPKRRLVFLLAGAALWLGIGFLAEQRRPSAPYLRVLTEEVHFERAGAIAREFPPGHPARTRLQETAEALKRLPPSSWPF